MTLMSEPAAPKVGIVDTVVSMDLDLPANASGVLYALGGFSGGLTVYVTDGAMDITIKVNDKIVGQGQVPTAISLHFTTNESFDIGSDTSSPVSLDHYDLALFANNGTIGQTVVRYPRK
jgi:arylsulfatase